MVNDTNCFSKYSVWIEFYKLKFAYYDYPHNSFDRRNNFSKEGEYIPIDVFTPNLISNSGSSFIFINGELNSPIHYIWFDIFGKIISNEAIHVESGIKRVSINTPVQEGFYFLVLEIDGVPMVRKVCVIE